MDTAIAQKLDALSSSAFRAKFKLSQQDREYVTAKGMEEIHKHASSFVDQRLAPEFPKNDGKQTPWRGHPVFVAQHATATCCRGCLARWHKLPKGRELAPHEQEYVVSVIEEWIERQMALS